MVVTACAIGLSVGLEVGNRSGIGMIGAVDAISTFEMRCGLFFEGGNKTEALLR